MPTIDIGNARTVADWLQIRGFPNSTILAGACRILYSFECGSLQRINAEGRFYPADADAVLARHPGLTDSVRFVMAHREGLKRTFRSDSTVVFLHYVLSKASKSKAESFIQAWATGASLEKGSPILLLRDKLQDDLVDPRSKLTPSVRLAFILKAWKHFYHDQTIKLLRYNEDEPFPTVAGFRYSKEGRPLIP